MWLIETKNPSPQAGTFGHIGATLMAMMPEFCLCHDDRGQHRRYLCHQYHAKTHEIRGSQQCSGECIIKGSPPFFQTNQKLKKFNVTRNGIYVFEVCSCLRESDSCWCRRAG